LFIFNAFLVSLKTDRELTTLVSLLGVLSFNLAFIILVLYRKQYWQYLLIFPESTLQEMTIWNVLYVIILNDSVMRLVSIIVKTILIACIGHIQPHTRKRLQLYSLVELYFSLYRSVLPIKLWFHYILQSDGVEYSLMSCILAGLYLTYKLTGFADNLKQLASTTKSYVFNELQFGSWATPEQVVEHGEASCPICQDNPMKSPVILQCNHLFCEECIAEWFEREKTCPICRAVVQQAGNKSYSDGSTPIFPTLF